MYLRYIDKTIDQHLVTMIWLIFITNTFKIYFLLFSSQNINIAKQIPVYIALLSSLNKKVTWTLMCNFLMQQVNIFLFHSKLLVFHSIEYFLGFGSSGLLLD